jgi:hypothetical protein
MKHNGIQVESIGPRGRPMIKRHPSEELWIIERGEDRATLTRDELNRANQAVIDQQVL